MTIGSGRPWRDIRRFTRGRPPASSWRSGGHPRRNSPAARYDQNRLRSDHGNSVSEFIR